MWSKECIALDKESSPLYNTLWITTREPLFTPVRRAKNFFLSELCLSEKYIYIPRHVYIYIYIPRHIYIYSFLLHSLYKSWFDMSYQFTLHIEMYLDQNATANQPTVCNLS